MADQVAAPGPTTKVDPTVEARLTNTGRFIRWIATGHAFIGLLGIVIPSLRGFPPSPFLVRDLTVAAAMSLGVLTLGALLAGDTTHSTGAGLALRRIGIFLSVVAALIGATIIGVYFANRTDIWGELLEVPSFSVGVVLLVLGISVPLNISRIESRVIAGQVASRILPDRGHIHRLPARRPFGGTAVPPAGDLLPGVDNLGSPGRRGPLDQTGKWPPIDGFQPRCGGKIPPQVWSGPAAHTRPPAVCP